jgi:hypothetical protein
VLIISEKCIHEFYTWVSIQKKTTRGKNKERLDAALNAIINENMKIREAGRNYEIHEAYPQASFKN